MSMLIDPVMTMQFSRRPRVERGSAGFAGCGRSGGEVRNGASRDADPPGEGFYAVGFRICLSRSCNVNAD
jgi:hypothetical protein